MVAYGDAGSTNPKRVLFPVQSETLRTHCVQLRHALPPETRLNAHGQGYDMVERPLICQDETMPLVERTCASRCIPVTKQRPCLA